MSIKLTPTSWDVYHSDWSGSIGTVTLGNGKYYAYSWRTMSPACMGIYSRRAEAVNALIERMREYEPQLPIGC